MNNGVMMNLNRMLKLLPRLQRRGVSDDRRAEGESRQNRKRHREQGRQRDAHHAE
jgi:hypothetical protein